MYETSTQEDTHLLDLLSPRSDKSPLLELIRSQDFFNPIRIEVGISSAEMLLTILRLCLKHSLPLNGILNFFRAINSIFRKPILPSSTYFINKLFNPETSVTYHKVCPNCSKYLGKVRQWGCRISCANCTHSFKISKSIPSCTSAFIDPTEAIAEYVHLFEDYYDSVIQSGDRNNDCLTDIHDGTAYRKFVNSLPDDIKKKLCDSYFQYRRSAGI